MQCKVDWISFTVLADPTSDRVEGRMHEPALSAIRKIAPKFGKYLDGEAQWADGAGRAPFKKSLRAANIGVAMFYGHKKDWVLVEISGQGCSHLEALNGITYLLTRVADRCTRIDVAVDIETTTTPSEFAEKRDSDRFKTTSIMTSQSGDTVYIGSRTSNRYARVYRYAAPHPRAALLRCEMVTRDEDAKATAKFIVDNTIQTTATSLGSVFKWTHPDWKPETAIATKIEVYRAPDHGGNTLRWLYAQVIPAVERMLEEGHQDQIRQFVASLATLCYDYYKEEPISTD